MRGAICREAQDARTGWQTIQHTPRGAEDTMASELHRIPDGDPPVRGIGGAGPTNQITMRRMKCVDGLEAALARVFGSLIIYDALFAAQHALIRAAYRTYEDCQKHGGRRNPLGLTKAASRLMEMESKMMGTVQSLAVFSWHPTHQHPPRM